MSRAMSRRWRPSTASRSCRSSRSWRVTAAASAGGAASSTSAAALASRPCAWPRSPGRGPSPGSTRAPTSSPTRRGGPRRPVSASTSGSAMPPPCPGRRRASTASAPSGCSSISTAGRPRCARCAGSRDPAAGSPSSSPTSRRRRSTCPTARRCAGRWRTRRTPRWSRAGCPARSSGSCGIWACRTSRSRRGSSCSRRISAPPTSRASGGMLRRPGPCRRTSSRPGSPGLPDCTPKGRLFGTVGYFLFTARA